MECEKLGSLHPETPFKEAYSIYESAYIYYMILFKLLTERVPQSHEYADAKIERRCQPLLEVYSTLKKSLLQDTMIDNVETFLIKYSNEDPSMKIISTQKVEGGHNLPSGPFLTVPQLQTILSDQKISVLLIDVRKRYEFEFSHINSVAVLPLDPISFKPTYTIDQLEKISFINSPMHELQLFQKRNEYDVIVLYTKDNDITAYYYKQMMSLLAILLNHLHHHHHHHHHHNIKYPKILFLKGGFSEWVSHVSKSEIVSNLSDGYKNNNNNSNNIPCIKRPVTTSPHQIPISMVGSAPQPPQIPPPRNIYPSPPQTIPIIKNNANVTNAKNLITPQGIMTNRSIPDAIVTAIPTPSPPPLPRIPMKVGGTNESIWKYNPTIIIGLENMSNSCYMNCIIQCLLSVPELIQICLNNSFLKHINMESKLGSKGVIMKHFAKLIQDMHSQQVKTGRSLFSYPVKTIDFKNACASVSSIYSGSQQQDCQEFCEFLLDGLHEDLNQCGGNPPARELTDQEERLREGLCMRVASSMAWENFLHNNFSLIIDLFAGQYGSQLRCCVCQYTSTTYQPFTLLSVPVPLSSRVSRCSIIDCFQEFTKCERLDKDEEWFCPQCKRKQPSTKQLKITRLPKNLIIHFKRFDNMMNKNNIFIQYPYELDLTPFWVNDFNGELPLGMTNSLLTKGGQVGPFKYQLNAVACHMGTLGSGHYTAYVNKGPDVGWYYFDDSSHRIVKIATEYMNPDAYLLFYHRVYN